MLHLSIVSMALGRSLVLAAALPITQAQQDPREYHNYTFNSFLSEFVKSYGELEGATRKGQFLSNLETIRAHNLEYSQGKHTWWMGVNQFADWTLDEFRALQTGRTDRMPGGLTSLRAQPKHQLPASVDWRQKGVVTPVKDQKLCGSCWAFAATETVESAVAIATQSLVELAPQTYVSCMKNPRECGGKGGCEGAIAELAYNYTVEKGIPTEADYPYMMGDFPCLPETTRPDIKSAVFVDGFVKLPANDADALATALATVGPVAVSIATDGLMMYGGGVYSGCSASGMHGMAIDHAVQAVGYSEDFWIIRNSWGSSWGEGGYVRLTRSLDSTVYTDKAPSMGFSCKPYPESIQVAGACGVLSDSSYPTGARKASPTPAPTPQRASMTVPVPTPTPAPTRSVLV